MDPPVATYITNVCLGDVTATADSGISTMPMGFVTMRLSVLSWSSRGVARHPLPHPTIPITNSKPSRRFMCSSCVCILFSQPVI